jgi:hypothetical protein
VCLLLDFLSIFLVQGALNIFRERNGIAGFGIQVEGHAIGTHQVLEEVMLHGFFWQLFSQSLIDGILPQGTDAKDGKVSIRIVFLKKGLYLRIRRQLLMKIGNGKGQDGKAPMHRKLGLQRGQLRKVRVRFASLAGRVDNQSDHARVLFQGLPGAGRILDRQTVNRKDRQGRYGVGRRIGTATSFDISSSYFRYRIVMISRREDGYHGDEDAKTEEGLDQLGPRGLTLNFGALFVILVHATTIRRYPPYGIRRL